jgi:hypothetical protein
LFEEFTSLKTPPQQAALERSLKADAPVGRSGLLQHSLPAPEVAARSPAAPELRETENRMGNT